MWPDDPVTETPASGGRAPRIDLRCPPLHSIPGTGIFYGMLFGVGLWLVLAVIVYVLL